MKTIALTLMILGALILVGGLVSTVVNVTDKYVPTVCEKALADKQKFRDARMICKDDTSDCYRRSTVGLTTDADCSDAKSYRMKAVTVSAVAAAIGFFIGLVGFVLRRRAARTATT